MPLDIIEHLFYYVVTMGTTTTDNNRTIDMICQHNSDGTIIPLKLRMLDDDGAYQEYKIRAYKDLTYKGNVFEMPDVGKVHSQGIYPFECKIESFGRERVIKLFYNSYEHTWKLAAHR